MNAAAVDKQHIIDEIKRTAAENLGIPLGRETFFRETGIKQWDWFGKYRARWGDALQEAGFQPNPMTTAYDDDLLIEKFIGLVCELGRFPVAGELRLRARTDATFPSHTTFSCLGGKRVPEELQLVHAIRTDDAYGIEEYWHKRFAAKNTKGEWFSLSREDVEAFKRRKIM